MERTIIASSILLLLAFSGYGQFNGMMLSKGRKNQPVTSGLFLWLDASTTASYPGSGSSWFDLSGNSYTATLVSTTFSSPNIVLGGNPARVTLNGSSLLNGNANFTASFWVNFKTLDANETLVSHYGFSGGIQIRKNSAHGINIVHSNVADLNTFTGFTVAANTEYNITVVKSGTTYSLYVNGAYVSQFTSATTFTRSSDTLGSNVSTTSEYFVGDMKRVLFYNTALTAEQILSNYTTFN